MKTMWLVSIWAAPQQVEIERTTESCVWVRGRRTLREANGSAFFATATEAWAWRINIAQKEADALQGQHLRALERLDRYRAAALRATGGLATSDGAER